MTNINATIRQYFLDIAITEYANDKIEAGTWNESEATNLAKDSYTRLLPNGVDTSNNFLFLITINSEIIGMIWVENIDKKLFIYDFMIDEEHRGKGYGKNSLSLLENWASESGIKKIGLHVFAHNTSAYGLYKKMGYVETDITMVRKIK